jgi:type IV pilus assembly protein PilX
MATTPNHSTQARIGVHAQRGVTLIIAMIALVILTVGAIAMTRSTDVTLRQAGNLAFKRDLANQGERAVAAALVDLRTGPLSTEIARQGNVNARNYSAAQLASSAQGIPNVLLSDSVYAAAGFSRPELADTTGSVAVRYVIDRQCIGVGVYNADTCQAYTSGQPVVGLGVKNGPNGADGLMPASARPVYRISVRITGPRGVQTFTQTTVML